MNKIGLALATSIIGLCFLIMNVDAFRASGWQKAHATFYGGSDASGTMGMFFFSLSQFSERKNKVMSI